jgi:hypothetical protein
LSNNDGVVIGIKVLHQFQILNSQPLSQPVSQSTIFNNPASPPTGGTHALTLIGYDDDLQAFKFINSWGTTNRGFNGYGWIAYDMLNDLRVNDHGVGVGWVLDKRNGSSAPVFIIALAGPGGSVIGDGLYEYGDGDHCA